MTVSSKFRRIFLGHSKSKDESSTSKQGRARGQAANGSQDNGRGAGAGSSQADDSSAARLAVFYSPLFGTEDERAQRQHKLVQDQMTSPWSAICHIRSTFTDDNEKGETNGTGFLINDTTAITAAHNLCRVQKDRSITPDSITLSLAGNAGQRIATRLSRDTVGKYAALEQLRQKNKEQIRSGGLTSKEIADIKERFEAFEDPYYYDYAAIFLDQPVEPKPNFFFKLRGADVRDPIWDRPLVCAGYPSSRQLYCAEGLAHPAVSDRFRGNQDYLVVHNVFAIKGESGAPLYVADSNGEFVAIGIFVRSNEGEVYNERTVHTNGAVRITKDMEGLLTRGGPHDLIA
jgi:V8-like Glu-specific endopeptidase